MVKGQKSSCQQGHQTMTMTNNKTTTINASFSDEHSMVVDFQLCKNGPSFTVATKLLLLLAGCHHSCPQLRQVLDILLAIVELYQNSRCFQLQQNVLVWLVGWLLSQLSTE
jgi:hypothetical protein